ncbi:hypothetical protein NE237_017224 [Protea cynaroides]|uniref:Uncharacterized protein n=1 Tax=Protea cynaroides TaxID=273540 RepID=A0A9Q0K7N5_9MAGN|nr:hypothetical protein NE237_017224 [Protea cynaroides]
MPGRTTSAVGHVSTSHGAAPALPEKFQFQISPPSLIFIDFEILGMHRGKSGSRWTSSGSHKLIPSPRLAANQKGLLDEDLINCSPAWEEEESQSVREECEKDDDISILKLSVLAGPTGPPVVSELLVPPGQPEPLVEPQQPLLSPELNISSNSAGHTPFPPRRHSSLKRGVLCEQIPEPGNILTP